jgi:hypothetical protein
MITKFDTSSGGGATATSGNGMKGLVTFIVIGIGLYVGYRFVVKPYLEKRNQNNDNE